MSLLVIVNHVKDGMELAHVSNNLPRATLATSSSRTMARTVVEYFYHQAVKQAENDRDAPDEDTFRYQRPAPAALVKPRSSW